MGYLEVCPSLPWDKTKTQKEWKDALFKDLTLISIGQGEVRKFNKGKEA